MKICVITSVPPGAEPRAPRHAVACKEQFPDAEVVFLELAAADVENPDPPGLDSAGLIRRKVRFPTRTSGLAALAWRKARVRAARLLMRLAGVITEPLFGERVIGLTRALNAERADVYFAHNIETLLPAARAARASGGRLIFDCMEYYADMGDAQTPEEARAAAVLEQTWLARCALVTASSGALADKLAAQYGIVRPLPLYNTPPVTTVPARKAAPGLALYWRNGTIGFGQRGLDDILVALTLLPADVTLSVQGRAPSDGGRQLASRIAELGLQGRVTVLGPYVPGAAVSEAAKHQVGLCLERRGPANHEYTVSNKLFDYLMAGLAVVVADLPSLRGVVERAVAGLLFEPGSSSDLAAKITVLREDPALLARLSKAARAFALAEGNVEVDVARLRAALAEALV